jgi:hypothetical protein
MWLERSMVKRKDSSYEAGELRWCYYEVSAFIREYCTMVDDLLPSKRPMKLPPSDPKTSGRINKPRNIMGYRIKLPVQKFLMETLMRY